MGALETNTTLIYGVHLRESANDGSDFSNAAADYRVLFLGEDGELHVKDSAGAVTGFGGGGAPTDATYITTSANGSLSAEVVHPELADNVTGSAVDMSGAATGTGVTANAATGFAGRIVFTNASYQYWDVASAISTGDFDLRCRITDSVATAAAGTSAPLFYFGVTDTGRTSTTGLYVRWLGASSSTGALQIQTYTGLGTTATAPIIYSGRMPMVVRVARSGTTVSRYLSFNDGVSWVTLGSTTSALDVGKIGVWGNPNGSTTVEALIHYVRSV